MKNEIWLAWLVLLPVTSRAWADDAARLSDTVAVRVKIEPATQELRVGDPLMLKVLVESPEPKTLLYDRMIGTVSGTLSFEVREPGARHYRRSPTRSQGGAYGAIRLRRQRALAPGAVWVAYETLFRHGRKAVFDSAGRYLLRARVIDNGGIVGLSEPIEIDVQPRPAKELLAIEAAADTLAFAVGPEGIASSVIEDDLQELRNAVEGGVLASTLDWTIDVVRLRYAITPEKLAKGIEAVDRRRESLDPITRDMMTICVARQLFRTKRMAETLAELGRLKTESFHKTSLAAQVREYLREYPRHP